MCVYTGAHPLNSISDSVSLGPVHLVHQVCQCDSPSLLSCTHGVACGVPSCMSHIHDVGVVCQGIAVNIFKKKSCTNGIYSI